MEGRVGRLVLLTPPDAVSSDVLLVAVLLVLELLSGVRAVRPSVMPALLVNGVSPEMVFLLLCVGVNPEPEPVPDIAAVPVIPGVAPAPNPGPSKLSRNSLSRVNSFPPAESPPNPLPPPS